MFSYIYDKMLYAYCYATIWVNQLVDEAIEFRDNALWIKENGPYEGPDQK